MWITEVYTIIVVVLKLIGVLEWSWWMVLLPETIAIVLYLVFYIITSIASIKMAVKTEKAIAEMHKSIRDKLNR